MIRPLLALSLAACAAWPPGQLRAADAPPPIWPRPVERTTGDRDADLLDALIDWQRFDDAVELCRDALQSLESTSDAAAKWRVRQSRVRTARQMTRDDFDDAAIETASAPVSELLRSYPEHDRRLFLRAAELDVLARAARHDITAAAVAASGEARGDRALARLTRLFRQADELIDQIEAARSQLRPGATAAAGLATLDADLRRLAQQLRVDRLEWSLLRTELFPPGSRDRIAAAAEAEQLADEAIAVLPAGSSARREVERLRIEAMLRSGQAERAEEAMDRLREQLGGVAEPRWIALQVRIDLAHGRSDRAAQRLEAFYGDRPVDAPRSAAVDLARLEYLLGQSGDDADGDGGSVGAWIEAIEQRSGPYLRRRAEAIALRSLGRADSSDDGDRDPAAGDPSLVAASGRDWLRRGEPGRAGELLAAAARAETEPEKAVRWATEAAAAWTSAERDQQAAEVLAETAAAHAEFPSAPAMHLQSAVVTAEAAAKAARDKEANAAGDVAALSDLLEQRLRDLVRRWPASEQAAGARRWLAKLLVAQDRLVEAAEALTPPSPQQLSETALSEAIELWQRAIRESDPDDVLQIGERFKAALRPLRGDPRAGARYHTAAVLLLDASALGDLSSRSAETSEVDPFIDALKRFRRGGLVESALRSPPQRWRSLAEWRLMRDGRQIHSRREVIADLLDQWDSAGPADSGAPDEPSSEKAERLLWQGETDQAVSMWRDLASRSETPAAVLRRAAAALGESSDAESLEAAVALWDELAAGLPKGSQRWHEAKLAAIRLLGEAGRAEEARRRARYILLTATPADAPLKKQYQSLSQP